MRRNCDDDEDDYVDENDDHDNDNHCNVWDRSEYLEKHADAVCAILSHLLD